ncbi:MAG: hypothetical protein Q4A44_02650 [Bacteroidales bacterium]|nr:hypothetical protein [Bacteroidales bacterium]
MERLVILVVLYEVLPEASPTLRSLSACRKWLLTHSHHIIVRDNSPKALTITQQACLRAMFDSCTLTYQHDGQNLPLSKVYNHVIANEVARQDFLLLLDDDTTFDERLITTFALAQQAYPETNLFLPIIRSGSAIVSPSHQRLFKGSYWTTEQCGLIAAKGVTAINSGMFIAGRYLRGRFAGYDERLAFYATDNYFMWRYSQHHETLYVLDYTLHHVLNFYAADESINSKVRRLRAMREGALILERQRNPWLLPLVYAYWDIFSIKCAIKQRSTQFLFVR